MKRSSRALETLLPAALSDIDEPVFIGAQAVMINTAPRTPLRTTALTERSRNFARDRRERVRVSDAKEGMLMVSPDHVVVGRVSQGWPAPVRV
jgi:hypothetical protein